MLCMHYPFPYRYAILRINKTAYYNVDKAYIFYTTIILDGNEFHQHRTTNTTIAYFS
jgi:hypothetical protein